MDINSINMKNVGISVSSGCSDFTVPTNFKAGRKKIIEMRDL